MARSNRKNESEAEACVTRHVDLKHFNRKAEIPYGLTINHLCRAMNEFLDFLSFINTQLSTKELPRFECFLMPANFSSIVGEFMTANIPRFCKTLVKNSYHNGHPDLLPKNQYPADSMLHAEDGIEVKASRYLKGWQGHNPENAWLMVFCFDANRIQDKIQGIAPKPFRFTKVVGAKLSVDDWIFSGRSETSRRTITASVTASGYEKMEKNWLYRAPDV